MSISPRRDKVETTTIAYTTHVVEVDLSGLLAAYDPTDNVVLVIQTPSGRAKRIAIGGNFLVAPHHTDEDVLPPGYMR